MNTVRTVSDTKRAFYAQHQRPINAVYRRVVEELMVEMHLLSVNQHFQENALYALGVVTAFDRFMVGYLPEADVPSIFTALCQAVEADPAQYRQRATALQEETRSLSLAALKQQFDAAQTGGQGLLPETLTIIANDDKFKYSRLLAIGLYTLVETVDVSALEDKDQRNALLASLADALGLSGDKVEKDLELYRSNLDKMAQAQEVMKDIVAADRKKRQQRADQAKAVTADKETAEDGAAASSDEAEATQSS